MNISYFVNYNDYNTMEEKHLTPWKTLRSPDPFLTLSNLQLEHNFSSGKKGTLCDRFMNEVGSIKCRLNF